MARRYEEGEAMPALAEAYGIAISTVLRWLKKLRVQTRGVKEAANLNWDSLRVCRDCGGGVKPNAPRALCPKCVAHYCQRCDKKLPEGWSCRLCTACRVIQRYKGNPPVCRVCGRIKARKTKKMLCNVHIKQFCQKCEAPLPRGRVCHYCAECERQKKLKLWEKPNRRCSLCGKREAVLHSSWCRRCMKDDYELRRKALAQIERPCIQCGAILPKGRRVNRCRACQYQHNLKRRKERRALGTHRCAQCGADLNLRQETYCAGCHRLQAKWREAWHAGDTAAKQIGTVRPQRKRQMEERR